MREIIKDKQVLARHILKEDIKEGLSFFSQDDEFIQVGSWNYDKNKELMKHIHNQIERKIFRES